MAIAAIYARFSSDSQRDESIEIQVDQCTEFIVKNGWDLGEVYADYARTGRTDDRPGFQRCIKDGIDNRYDVLVVYKNDRFARNVEIAQKYKRMLFDAGVKLFYVREGEVKDTPEGFLFAGISDLWSDYYSRNLSVLIKDGNQKNAEKLKASGVRRFGYTVDENDHFVIDESEAEVVRDIFNMYLSGMSSNQIANALNARGVLTIRGNKWHAPNILKMLKNDAYIGTYNYAGHKISNAFPAIIEEAQFYLVQEMTANRTKGKRMSNRSDYVLSNKLYCLKCGHGMSGTSGTSATGRKYRYYTCAKKKDGCDLKINADVIEKHVIDELRKLLSDDETVDMITRDMIAFSNRLPSKAEGMRAEMNDLITERDRLVDSIAQGIPPTAVKPKITSIEERIQDLDQKIKVEEFRTSHKPDEAELRKSVQSMIDNIAKTPDRAALFISNFIDRIYADEDTIFVIFSLGDGGDPPPSHKDVISLVDDVRVKKLSLHQTLNVRTFSPNSIDLYREIIVPSLSDSSYLLLQVSTFTCCLVMLVNNKPK